MINSSFVTFAGLLNVYAYVAPNLLLQMLRDDSEQSPQQSLFDRGTSSKQLAWGSAPKIHHFGDLIFSNICCFCALVI